MRPLCNRATLCTSPNGIMSTRLMAARVRARLIAMETFFLSGEAPRLDGFPRLGSGYGEAKSV
jgi:hypothetical protein